MPQTREHLAVLRQLGVDAGVVAVTKADVADPARAAAEVAELVPDGTPVVPVSAPSSAPGIDELLAALGGRRGGAARPRARPAGAARLHVDRSFTLRGIGTVVTGTLWSGAVGGRRRGDGPAARAARARALGAGARRGRRARRRRPARGAEPGRRRLARGRARRRGVRRRAPARADLPDRRARRWDGEPPSEPSVRLHVHHGTREAPARVVPLGEGLVAAAAGGAADRRARRPVGAAPGGAAGHGGRRRGGRAARAEAGRTAEGWRRGRAEAPTERDGRSRAGARASGRRRPCCSPRCCAPTA